MRPCRSPRTTEGSTGDGLRRKPIELPSDPEARRKRSRNTAAREHVLDLLDQSRVTFLHGDSADLLQFDAHARHLLLQPAHLIRELFSFFRRHDAMRSAQLEPLGEGEPGGGYFNRHGWRSNITRPILGAVADVPV